MASKTLGETIQEARAAHYKLRELARKLRISPTHLSDIENDRRVPSEELLTEIARHLDLDLVELLVAARRVPEDTRRYIEQVPEAVSLFRMISVHGLRPKELEELGKAAEKLVRDRKRQK